MRKNRLEPHEIMSIKSYVGSKSVRFDEALNDFCSDRRRIGVRESTIDYYTRFLTMFRRYIIREKDEIIPVDEIDVQLLDGFVEYLRDVRRNSTGGINAKIRAIRAFLFFCEDVGYISHNPAKDWKQIRGKEPEINTFTVSQINALLKQPDRRKLTGLRDYLLILFLIDTGARISEALGVKVSDVKFEESRVYLRNTKSNLNRYVPMSDRLSAELRQFIRIHAGMSEYVFCNLRGDPIRRDSFRLILNELGKRAGITNVRCSPHTCRHTFSKFYILNGGDVFSLMQILGHSTLDMTKKYVRLFGTDIVNKHRKYSPLNNI
ncbi:tyrosine-type recombinase/integrase [Halalkalibacter oceani]|uniref:tyrosine-type recombinase/integrase n=1 Tax=Halalkalibacter oceani TaxID=1653776 RepID=UPI0033983A0C